jgi:3-oxoacyl-[acyl-carrier-protein] synthase-3
MSLTHARITGLGRYVPSRVVTNDEMATMVETSDEWIRSRTGIAERRFASAADTTATMSAAAASEALEHAGVDPADVDLVMVATSTPDFPLFPATACLVQDSLGLKRAGAYDLSAACSGFVYGLVTATQFIQTGAYRCILLVGSDVLSRSLDFTDRSTCILFGDGASAVVIQASDEPGGLLSFVLGADGAGADHVIVEGGGSRYPLKSGAINGHSPYIAMKGREVYRFSTTVPTAALERAAAQAGHTVQDLDIVLAHQANVRILQTAAHNLGIPEDRFYANMDRYGNTSAASVPLALYDAAAEGRITPGCLIGFMGFGAGLTWATALWRWQG